MSCPSVDPGQPPRETEIAPYVAPYVAPGDLSRAIARIGELDCTRTLPGRLVWYHEGACRLGQECGWPCTCGQPKAPVVVRVTWPNGEPDPGPVWCEDCHRHRYSVDETGRCFTCRAVANGYVPRSAKPAPTDHTRQGGLESWGRANGSEPLDVQAAIANGDSR